MKAKRHQLLSKLVQGEAITTTVNIDDHVYMLQTLNTAEEDWVNQFLSGDNATQMAAGTMTPRVSASLVSIDGISVAELFVADTDDDTVTDRKWLREQVLEFVGELPPATTVKLLNAIIDLGTEQSDAEGDLGNSSRRTLSGASELTSSPEKVSSLQIQA